MRTQSGWFKLCTTARVTGSSHSGNGQSGDRHVWDQAGVQAVPSAIFISDP